jgi:nucleotide-binding universal stress UspA family protein
MYKTIMVAVDISHGDVGAELVERAKSLLDEGGKLHLVYVLEDVPPYVLAELPRETIANRRSEAQGHLEAIAAKSGVEAEVHVKGGHPSSGILEAAKEYGADLLMIASHRPDLRDYFIGSTASRVVRYAQCSVLIAR